MTEAETCVTAKHIEYIKNTRQSLTITERNNLKFVHFEIEPFSSLSIKKLWY